MQTIANRSRKACISFCSDYLMGERPWILSLIGDHHQASDVGDDVEAKALAIALDRKNNYDQQYWLRELFCEY